MVPGTNISRTSTKASGTDVANNDFSVHNLKN